MRKFSKRIFAEDEMVDVAQDTAEVLFEAEDVAELVAEITGEDVEVSTDEESDAVVFTVGDEAYTVEPDGSEEVVESSRQMRRNARPVKANSRRRPVRRTNTVQASNSKRRPMPVKANRRPAPRTTRTVRRVGR